MKRLFVWSTIAVWIVLPAFHAAAQHALDVKALEDRFKVLDKNGDGKITSQELPASPFFAKRDLNGDGVITLDEVKAAAEAERTSEPTHSKAVAPNNAAAARPQPAKQRVQRLVGGDLGVGRMLADLSFNQTNGTKQRLSSWNKQRAVVFAATSTSCPLSKKYLPTLASLAKKYGGRGIVWVLVNPIATDRQKDIETAIGSLPSHVIYVHDRDGQLANALGTRTTTDVVVIDAARTVIFHGAIDDQYGLGFATDAPRHHFLADALDALLAKRRPLVTATEAPGCTLAAVESSSAKAPESAIDYHSRISRIMQNYCVECHRDGGVGPFPLSSYDDVVSHAGMIQQVVQAGTMPPWFAGPLSKSPEGAAELLWANDRSMAESDKADLLRWLASGKAEGDKRDAPKPQPFAKGWSIGQPDAVFEFPKPVAIKATGIMPYQNVLVETKLTEDQWVEAIEIQPGNREVVHHMTVFLQSEEKEHMTALDEAVDERLGFWAVYVPGNATLIYPKGFAKALPRGANLRCQVHYTPIGVATSDKTRIGVVFAKHPPKHEVRVVGICNPKIEIPPGAENHREDATLRLPYDIEVLSFLPHLHYRGKACRYNLVRSNGATSILLDIPRYDFNWQLLYRYYEPQRMSRGDAIKFTAWFDNSRSNPANPDPDQTVRWGKQASDEMHLGYVEYFIPANSSPKATPPTGRRR